MVLVYFVGVIAYAWWTDFIPEKRIALQIPQEDDNLVDRDTLSFLNWNIGYAGLGKESDFFYDGGETVTAPKQHVEKNLRGILKTISDIVDSIDFFLLQEVDLGSKRTHWINQFEKISNSLKGFTSSFGKNYDVQFIPIPMTDPMGRVRSGLGLWSKFKMIESTRHAFEGNYNFPHNLFFLDRCFVLNRYKTKKDKELIVVNTHNSAFDDGSLKKKQLAQLKSVLIDEYEKGNYVIVGGDWNQLPSGFGSESESKKSIPDNYPAPGWKCMFDPDVPTCRSLTKPFNEETPTVLIDFYVVSPNVEVLDVNTIDQKFQFSDHQPVMLKAVLN